MSRQSNPAKRRLRVGAVALLMALLAIAACGSSGDGTGAAGNTGGFEVPTAWEVQPGAKVDQVIGSFEPDAELEITDKPEWLTEATVFTNGEGRAVLSLTVPEDAPAGTYSLSLNASTSNTEISSSVPFTVTG